MSPKIRTPILLAVLTFGLFTFLSVNWHSHGPKFDYRSEIWADRAGYHVYLPAWFDYGFRADRFPAGMDTLTGGGFQLDSIPGKVVTRYTCGEAMLRIPFYLIGKLTRTSTAEEPAGFTPTDHIMVDVAASFYASLGGLLLFLVLRRRVPDKVAALAVIVVFTGTNLLFYTIGDSGMSHVYSFFLFATWLFLLHRRKDQDPGVIGSFLMGVVGGLIVLTRPTNLIFIPISFVLLNTSYREAWLSFRDLMKPGPLTWIVLGAVTPWIAQIHYWNTTFGSPLVWSYGKEGFTNFLDPSFVPFWFAPYNGLFPYTPLILLVLVVVAWNYRKHPAMNGATLLSFAMVSYISTAWFAWTFGCGFGSRNFVEYSAVFAFPIASLLGPSMRMPLLTKMLLAICCLYTLKLTFSCSNCWFGDVWDWPMFTELLLGPIK